MKRIAVVVLSGLIVAGTLSAQAPFGGAAANAAGQTATITKVEGSLALVNGMIAVKTKDKTYYVEGLQHLLGFIDGLKEGASVKLEGYAQSSPLAPEYSMLRLTKLALNGRDFDLSQVGPRGMGMDGGPGMDGRRGPGMDGSGMSGGRGAGPQGGTSSQGNRG